ncbi:MAG TPA: KpsF/GutQ family sugar-phosphate isomerase [Candidatus Tidjanibacter gallistercoris]|nr:KpsF/GutQ family sugar-phosphate isomerase [Candidatus Tidjanibacter gallistercoris]
MSPIRESALNTFRAEAEAVEALAGQLTEDFEKAVRAILATHGKVIVTGMGKSGLVGRKIAATLASTGTPSFFLHPGEAYHGDLGMIEPGDIVLALSNSGQTDEVLRLIPYLQDNGNTVIAMTGNAASTLARNSTYHLDVSVKSEACPLSLAPTCSTTAQLAMGDALAVALMNERGFRAEDFARFHPGGSLGRRLLTRVGDVMRSEHLPTAAPSSKLGEVIITISDARMGVAVIMDGERIAGIVTDGDVRRAMLQYGARFFDITAGEIMTRTPKVTRVSDRLTDAEQLMQDNKIHSLIVVDDKGALAGIVELYDLMRSGK